MAQAFGESTTAQDAADFCGRCSGPKAGVLLIQASESLKPGGPKLVREWHGDTHEVLVLDKGFACARRRLIRSLSAIARAITGAHWNGLGLLWS